MVGAQAAQGDVADRGADVAVAEPRVPVGGGGAHLAALLREPRVLEEVPDGNRAADLGQCRLGLAVDARSERFGVGAVVAGGVPSPPLLAGEGVESVVGDDVEAVFALNDVGHLGNIDDFVANPKIMEPPLPGTAGVLGKDEAGAAGADQANSAVLPESWRRPSGASGSGGSPPVPR